MAFVTLNYLIRTGVQNPAAVLAKVTGIGLGFLSGELEMLDMSVNSHTEGIVPGGVNKEIVLNVLPAGASRWPTPEELRAATRNLYTLVYGALVPSLVSASEPVVS